MNKKDNYEQTMKTLVVAAIFFVILVAIYSIAISTSNELLLIVTAVITSVIILFNLILVSKNKKKTNNMRKMILKNNIGSSNLNPIEIYLVDKIWYHKKGKLSYRQIYSALLYNISEGNIVYNGSKLGIKNNFKFDNLSEIDRFTLEIAFLDAIEFKKNDKLKDEILLKLQKEDLFLTMEDIKRNIDNNCKNRSAFYDLLSVIKSKYFVDIEGGNEAVLTIFSWICVILEVVLGISYINDGSILGFYLPISLAFILTFLTTSKYRERVVLKTDKKEEISDILNYIRSFDDNSSNNIDKIYLYALNRLKDTDNIFKIFFIE